MYYNTQINNVPSHNRQYISTINFLSILLMAHSIISIIFYSILLYSIIAIPASTAATIENQWNPGKISPTFIIEWNKSRADRFVDYKRKNSITHLCSVYRCLGYSDGYKLVRIMNFKKFFLMKTKLPV